MSGVKAWKERSRAGGRGEPVHLTKPEVFQTREELWPKGMTGESGLRRLMFCFAQARTYPRREEL